MRNNILIKFLLIDLFLIFTLNSSKKSLQEIDISDINLNYIDANLSAEKTIGHYPGYKNLQLNYKNECSEYFKYRKNSRTDIVIFAYTYREERNFSEYFDNLIDSFKHSVPKAIIATVIPKKDCNSTEYDILKKHGIKLIIFEGYEDYNIVTSRYIIIYDFLKKNIHKYKRVFLSDISDVYMFNDIFSTFNEDEIIINKQCYEFESENCHLLFPREEDWFNEFFINQTNTIKDLELIENIGKDKINPIITNAGIIFGGINKMIQFLKIFKEYVNPNKAKFWGYDQILIILLVNKKKFESIGLKIERCTQRICFKLNVKYNLNTTKIIYRENMCSPIVLHKSIPINWKIVKKPNNSSS